MLVQAGVAWDLGGAWSLFGPYVPLCHCAGVGEAWSCDLVSLRSLQFGILGASMEIR